LKLPNWVRHYGFSLLLLCSFAVGALIGLGMGEKAAALKPLGDIFLNLLFTAVVPLVFFSIASAVGTAGATGRLGKIVLVMLGLFVTTGIIASLVMIAGVMLFNPTEGMTITIPYAAESAQHPPLLDAVARAFTVPDFADLLSRKSMLALIIFAAMVGMAAGSLEEKGKAFRQFLLSASAVMEKVIGIILWYAPVGLGAYFAYLVGVFGPELMGTYARAMALYYPVAIGYFFVGFSFYAYLAGGIPAIKMFWSNIVPTALTAFATGSSVASIPLNLEAAKENRVPADIREVIIPIGSTIHMDGSCLSAILKIVVLFGVFQMPFTGLDTIAKAVMIALLSGTVMSGIPGGGFIGELMIVTLYGFPAEALPIATMIGTLVDPPATMVNAVGDNVVSMLSARILGGKNWMEQGER